MRVAIQYSTPTPRPIADAERMREAIASKLSGIGLACRLLSNAELSRGLAAVTVCEEALTRDGVPGMHVNAPLARGKR